MTPDIIMIKEEMHEIVAGSFAQGGTREDIEIMIHNMIEDYFGSLED